MKRDSVTLTAGFMPAVCMGLLLMLEYFIKNGTITADYSIIILSEVLPFILPLCVIALVKNLSKKKVNLRLGGFTRHAVPFVLWMSITVALLSFLINCAMALVLGEGFAQQTQLSGTLGADKLPMWMSILIIVILPSITEELFFRGGMLGAFESSGTYVGIIASGLCFALVHGNISNMAGPLVAGLVYGYMTYALGSVWPAIFAHMINNGYFMLTGYITKAYETLGFWPYYILATFVCFCVFLYFSMVSLEKLIEKGRIERFKSAQEKHGLAAFVTSPGILLLIIMFVIKTFYL